MAPQAHHNTIQNDPLDCIVNDDIQNHHDKSPNNQDSMISENMP